MGERLDCVRIEPRRLADIGCATGDGVRALMRRYPAAMPLAIDYAWPMLAAMAGRSGWWERMRGRVPSGINADVRALPLAGGTVDLVWSNLMLHWLAEPQPAFAELHRVLAEGGLLQFAMLGPDTLKELRTACVRAGAIAPLPAFVDMHDIGDMLVGAGFADPVMEMEMLTLTYRTPRAFLADQRRLGVRDALLGRLGWRQWRSVLAAWERVEGVLPARFEIIYGHAWKAAPRTMGDDRNIVRFHHK